ncbi:MAG: hydantoinase B/oxoprolinase family protein, partial [Gammaproteobacteria bacterium]|nr:hydantoinase B/oxoprolinase family protein [Gammaproteobacteria bacterium]
PAKCDEVDVKEGDVLYFNTWGGGGWGDPTARDPAVVKIDVDRGLVSREGARRYGVVLGDDGSVDTDATDALRNELRLQHTDDGLFNYGGTIEELKARSLEETHLEAPVAPTF